MTTAAIANNDQQSAPPARYPTTRELVAAALTDPATHAARTPTWDTPNYVLPGEDVDGNPRPLAVVALGGHLALVDPDGRATVLRFEAATRLAETIEDSIYFEVHGGDMTLGRIDITTDTDLRTIAKTTLSVDVRPHASTAEMRLESQDMRISWPVDQDKLAAIAEMCTAAAQVLRGEVPSEETHEDEDNSQVDVDLGASD